MRVQSNGLAGPNIAAGSGEAFSSKQFPGLMRACSVPKASFPVLQERLVLSVDDFFRIPVSAEGNGAEQPKKNHQRQPNNACIFSRQQRRDKEQTTVGQSVRKRRANASAPKKTVVILSARIGDWMAGERRKQRKAQCARAMQSRARLPAYSPLTRLLHSCTTWQWLASELCVQSTPLQYRRDSRAEVTAHRAGSAASGDP